MRNKIIQICPLLLLMIFISAPLQALQYPPGYRVIEEPTYADPWGGETANYSTPQRGNILEPAEDLIIVEAEKESSYDNAFYLPGIGYFILNVNVDINIWKYISLDDEKDIVTENSTSTGSGSR